MVEAWYYDESSPADPREPHKHEPNQAVSLDKLKSIGILARRIDVNKPEFMDEIENMCKVRQYKNRDEITISPEKLPNYEEKLKMFFTEHIHEDEEIRFILEGSGYFDVREKNDRWIRIHTQQSDLIILPAGIYHRFILDSNNYIKAMRLFKEDPKWTPLNRDEKTDVNPYRVEYIKSFLDEEETTAAANGEEKEKEQEKKRVLEMEEGAEGVKKARTEEANGASAVAAGGEGGKEE
ncbi:1,2-dihydroxy-3-keto-5-methylthiopentene dioxygenase [Quaeritorhiza haematococci]|nr:1,2-dihydroxy-3-keto-5-methylthiopentene dioxygenase [Quaeritorhiza haematococci]